MKLSSRSALAVLTFVSLSCSALAQGKAPSQIKLLVGFPPGGSTDVLARTLAQEAGKQLGRDIIIINKAGASGAVAAAEVASADPDGSTIGITPSSTMTLSHLFQGIKPDLLERTSALLQVGSQPIGIATKSDSPFVTLADLIAAIRKDPGKIALGIPGAGTTTDVLLRAVLQQEKLVANVTPFRGDVPTATAILGGHIAAAGLSAAGFAQHVETKAMRVLLSLESTRLDLAPDVPTARELGYDIAGNAIQFMYAPKGIPAAERTRLIEVFGAAAKTGTYIDIAKKNVLFSASSLAGDELDRYLLADRARNTALVTRLGLGKQP